MSTVRAIRVEDIRDGDGKKPGAYEIRHYENQTGIAFRCPCGCGNEAWLPLAAVPENSDLLPRWGFDGNEASPTLTPSIAFSGGCRWHGFLTAGEWVSC